MIEQHDKKSIAVYSTLAAIVTALRYVWIEHGCEAERRNK